MVAADDFSPLLRIELAGYLGRADKIAEQYREMPPRAFESLAWVFLLNGAECGFVLA